jgi:hypothetical protein|tara:strand:- start:5296 stop:5796 length:501 start_codon:yes stop_codon:yes gene_type:complete
MTTGTVEAVRKDRKGFKLEGSEEWYSVYEARSMSGVNRGSEVEFEFTRKDRWLNVVGGVVVLSGGGPASTSVSLAASSPSGTSSRVAAKGGEWPIPQDLAAERRIMRQNALERAMEYFAQHSDPVNPKHVIRVAREFESYFSGDLDMEEFETSVLRSMGPEAEEAS